jgi:signal transduction histidine kinase
LIIVRLAQSHEAAIVSVEDNGPGIGADEHQRALQPFGRLARDGSVDGTGLGLALAAATARLHGGTLVLSDANPGLIVTLTLPKQKPVGYASIASTASA